MSGSRRSSRRLLKASIEKREARREQIHGEVLAGRTMRDLWLVWVRAQYVPHGIPENDPDVEETIRPAFYAGAASVFELVTRVAPDEVTEDQGVDMLQRLHEELETFTKRRHQS